MSDPVDGRLSRRRFLGGVGGLAALGATRTFGNPAFAASSPGRDEVVVVTFLRGAADGLSMLVPRDDPDYVAGRPTLAIPARGLGDVADARFGRSPALAALSALNVGVAYVPAFGAPHPTRSHFAAQALIDRGSLDPSVRTGWAARLAGARPDNGSLLRVVNMTDLVSGALRGHGAVFSARDLASAQAPFGDAGRSRDVLGAFAGAGSDAYSGGLGLYVASMDEAARIRSGVPARVGFPPGPYAASLRDISKVIRADVGCQIACADLDGWDTHTAQAPTMHEALTQLADTIVAFFADLGPAADRVTLVVMTEFGRHIAENASGGTDHGHGGVAMVIGNVNSGVHGDWRGLGRDGGDVPVLNDWRALLGELAERRCGVAAADVTPNWSSNVTLDLFAP